MKSIVPWAWEAPANVNVSRVGPIARDVWIEFCLETFTAHRSAEYFIAAGLNAEPKFGSDCKSFCQIKARATSLSVNNKTQSFSLTSDKVTNVLKEFGGVTPYPPSLHPDDVVFLESSVAATVISIVPADENHLNQTFAFCRATGLKKSKVQGSIADGCFQSLRAFAQYSSTLKTTPASAVTGRSKESPAKDDAKEQGGCPYFHKDERAFVCPFSKLERADPSDNLADVPGIHELCVVDKTHKWTIAWEQCGGLGQELDDTCQRRCDNQKVYWK